MDGLHLHRLDGGHGVAGLDLVALGDREGDHAGERRGDVARVGPVRLLRRGTSEATEVSRTWIGRSWPFRVDITVRMPRSSASPTASSSMSSRTPGSRSTAYSLPGRSP